MTLREINFDGIVGPSHNYAGLSLGNLATTRNAGQVSQPRAAALEGVTKMRANCGHARSVSAAVLNDGKEAKGTGPLSDNWTCPLFAFNLM